MPKIRLRVQRRVGLLGLKLLHHIDRGDPVRGGQRAVKGVLPHGHGDQGYAEDLPGPVGAQVRRVHSRR